MALETEIATFQRKRDELLLHVGKFALIHGEDVAGIYDTWELALNAGYDKFGLAPFLVKQIELVETVFRMRRGVPCR